MTAAQPRSTFLSALHERLGARMVDFAGWRLPLQFSGIVAEHNQVRTAAGLFDVSHMCQFALTGSDRVANAQRLLPIDAAALKPGRNKYTFMCNEQGGVIDDLVIGNDGERLFVVCNAARAERVLAHVTEHLHGACALERLADRALLALQGPQAAALIAKLAPEAEQLFFMDSLCSRIADSEVRICRCGYTGEDGFEISADGSAAVALAEQLIADGAAPAGLGARDLLRIEAGLCLYGNELDEQTNPVAAGLAWSISPRRRREGGFIGDQAVLAMLAEGSRRQLVGLSVQGRLPLRRGAKLDCGNQAAVGEVTSGGWSPVLEKPVAIAFVESAAAKAGTQLAALVRDKSIECEVVSLPHVAHNYKIRPRKPAGN
ncbi:MAG: glycine cleavage system aminomethyltransferase GcvT [Betaproteobacteria bacterium]|nr:glycine cleavage system aminomethyltransferase GcvT [Betaproteobacteria bacterium]